MQTGLDRTAAAASEARANEWAESGVEVEPGQYSAKYWAGQASQIITDGVIDDNATNTEKTWSSQKVNDLVVRWLSISTSSALSAMGRYAVDFTSGPLTLTLPSSPSADDFVEIYASAGDATSSTIARNGQTIMGLAEDLTLNYAATWLRLVFNGTDWRIVA